MYRIGPAGQAGGRPARRVETGRVRIRLHTDTDTETVSPKVSAFDQQVQVERVPVGREVSEAPGVMIIPVLEEVLVVEKRHVLKEELHVRLIVTQTEVTRPTTLRRQWAEVERSKTNTMKE